MIDCDDCSSEQVEHVQFIRIFDGQVDFSFSTIGTLKQVFNKLWTKKSPQIKYGRPADTMDTMRM